MHTVLRRKMKYSMRVVFVAVALLTAPIASHGQQCDLPTQQDVENAGGSYLTMINTEGSVDVTMSVQNMHFTCLSRVAFDKYSFASVVVNATASNNLGVPIVRQFQLQCNFVTNVWGAHQGNVFDSNVPSMPFGIETEFQCSACVEQAFDTPNYNAATNCQYCDPVCLDIGGGFCTGETVNDCCPFFNSDTGACEEDCTTIDPNFGGDDGNHTCVCQISCQPGYTANFIDCSCEFSDGCEAAGQPCDNGGTCTSHLSTSPYYSCQCPPAYTDPNCTTNVPTIALTPTTSATTAPIIPCPNCAEGRCDMGCCEQCDDHYRLDETNCTCEPVPTTEPTRPTTPVCPCRDCEVDNPTCCSACDPGYEVRSCECVEIDEGRTLAASELAGITIGIVLFVLLILALAVLLAYVLYYVWASKEKVKTGKTTSPFSNGESHSNPLYLTPEEVEVE